MENAALYYAINRLFFSMDAIESDLLVLSNGTTSF